MSIKKLIITIILFAAVTNAQQKETLDRLVERAIELSPKIAMLHAKLDAAKSRININSNLPDPMLTLGLANLPVNSFSFTQEPMTGKVIGLSQAFPYPGKLSAISKAAAQDTVIILQDIEEAKNEIRKEVIKKYYDLYYLDKAIELSSESKELLKQISEVVASKYSVNTASQQNLIKTEFEITNLTDKIESLISRKNAVEAELEALVLMEVNDLIIPDSILIPLFNYNEDELLNLARENKPSLEGLRSAKRKAELTGELADYDYYPNFNLALQYSFRDEIARTNTDLDDFFTVVVGISLPLNYGGKVSSKIEESIYMQDMFAGEFLTVVQMLQGKIGAAVAELQSLKERILLFREGLLLQASESFRSALSDYQVGKLDFINVIDSQNMLYQVQTNLEKLKSDYMKQLAELEFLTGTELINVNE